MAKSISPTENLSGSSAVEKIASIAIASGICFFTTKDSNSSSRPMALQDVDNEGNLWFLSDVESNKNREILSNPEVELYFINNSKYEYVFIKGKALISQDRQLIEKYWTNFANAWFDGKEDPNVSVIKVIPYEGYYYETKDNKLVALSKMLFSEVTGKSVEDGGIEGQLEL